MPMKNSIKLIFIALCNIFMLFSCQRETMNVRGDISSLNPDEFLKTEVRVLDNTLSDGVVETFDVENNVLKFSAELPLDELPQEGHVIASGISENVPYGLLARVVSIEKKNGVWHLTMEDVGLDEVFEDLQIDTLITITEDNIGTFYDAEGNEIIPVKSSQRTRVDEDDNKDEIEIGTNFFDGGFSTSLNVSHIRYGGKGKISYGVDCGYRNIAFRFNLNKKEKFYASIEPFIDLRGSLSVTAEKDVFKDDDPLVLYKHLLPPITIYPYGIPIVLRPQVNLTMESSIKASATFQTDFSMNTGFFMMMKYDDSWKTDFDFRSNLGENRVPFSVGKVELAGSIGSGFGLEYFVGLYGRDFGCGLKGSLNMEDKASFTLDSDIDEILDLNPQLEVDVNLEFEALFKSKVWGVKLFNDLSVKTPPFHVYNDTFSILPRFINFNPIEDDSDYVLRYDVDAFSLTTLLGNKYGWSLFDESEMLLETHTAANGDQIRDLVYRYEPSIDGLSPGKKYFVAPMAQLGGIKLHGKKTPLEPDKKVMFCFRCESRDYDVLRFDFDLSKAASNSIDVRYDANDYDGSPMSMHITGYYNTDTQVFSGAVDFLFYNDPGQQRIDGFTIDLKGSDSGYVTCHKIVDNNACTAAVRVYEVGTEPAEASKILSKSSCNIGLYNPHYN